MKRNKEERILIQSCFGGGDVDQTFCWVVLMSKPLGRKWNRDVHFWKLF